MPTRARIAAIPLLLCFALASLVVAPDFAPTRAGDADLESVLERFDRVQSSIRTLTAELRVTNHHRLLVEPEVNVGRLYLTKPAALRWEFETPETMRFIIADDFYTGYFPDQRKAERKNIKRWSEHLFRYFGLGQGSRELRKFYTIRLGQSDVPGTHLLVLDPKKRRARKRIEDVRFWVDAETMLPRMVEYRSEEGNRRLVEFESIRVNTEIAQSLYRIDLPEDVEIRTGFTPFGGGGS